MGVCATAARVACSIPFASLPMSKTPLLGWVMVRIFSPSNKVAYTSLPASSSVRSPWITLTRKKEPIVLCITLLL